MTAPRHSERGVTLTELTIVGVLAVIVMLGLMGFYLNSQSIWVDGSTQAQAQRETTLLVETLSDSIRAASSALVSDYPSIGSPNQMIQLFSDTTSTTERCRFWWNPGDSLVHAGVGDPSADQGPVILSKVEKFQLRGLGTRLVELSLLQARTANGTRVQNSSRFALYNR